MPDGVKMTVKVDLHGTEEALLQAGPKIAKRLLRKALKAVGELWKVGLRNRAPILNSADPRNAGKTPGELRDSIDYKIKTGKNDMAGSVTVGPTYDTKAMKNSASTSESPGVYGMFVEFGLDEKNYTKTPFMRPEFDSSAELMVQIFAEKLREDLEDALKS